LAVAVATVVVAAGCGGDGGEAANDQSIHATVSNGIVSLPVSIEGATTMPFLLDTGAVLTRLDPTRFGALAITPGLAQVSTLDVGNVHLADVEVIAASLCGAGMMCPDAGPAGLLGGAVMDEFAVTIDYRRSAVTFGAFTAPAGGSAPVTIPFALEGGGSATVGDADVTLPATRIAVDVNIEGMSVPMLVDTGSSTMVLAPALYDALVADGRAQTTSNVVTVTGPESVPATKLRTVTVGGAAQSNVAAVRSPLDMELLDQEVGHTVEGLVGGAYLQNYLTTIDYPARELTLRPY
jgi:predicted aspartyl protease